MEFEFEILREPQKKYFRYFKIIGTRNATDNTVLPANLLIFSILYTTARLDHGTKLPRYCR